MSLICIALTSVNVVSLVLGQSYEIKVKKLGDLSDFQGKLLRVIKCL